MAARGRLAGAFAACVCAFAALPAVAGAATQTFANITALGPSGSAALSGPATRYPSSIPISGVAGTVTDVNVAILGASVNADTDLALRGPNGQTVLLMADACDQGTAQRGNFIFDDSAPVFLSRTGQCSPSFPVQQSFRPSNYLPVTPDPNDSAIEPDDLSVAGGPAPPYVNQLSFLAGGSPNGSWDLFVLDDNALCCVGFEINSGWALTLEIEAGPTGPATPSNEFTIGGFDGKRLSVDLASAGTVVVDDSGSKDRLKESSTSGGPGVVEIRIKLTKSAKQKLRNNGKVAAGAEVTFTPTGGSAASQTTRLKFRK